MNTYRQNWTLSAKRTLTGTTGHLAQPNEHLQAQKTHDPNLTGNRTEDAYRPENREMVTKL